MADDVGPGRRLLVADGAWLDWAIHIIFAAVRNESLDVRIGVRASCVAGCRTVTDRCGCACSVVDVCLIEIATKVF